MVAADLHEVLNILYEAGASRVPAADIGWTKDMAPVLNHALNMQYMVHHDTDTGRLFSLTDAGYTALGHKPPSYMSVGRILGSLFGRKRSHID